MRAPVDERGWFRFQRLYDAARACVTSEADMRRIVAEAAADDAAEGSGRLEIQVDPTSYAPHVGGITPALEIVLDEARAATARTGVEVAVVVAELAGPPPAGGADAGPVGGAVRGGRTRRGGRVRAVQRRAPRGHGRVGARVRDRPPGRPRVGPARRGAAGRLARGAGGRAPGAGPDRPRGALRGGPRGARLAGRPGCGARGLPRLERVARGVRRGPARPAAHAHRRGRDRRARRRRPAAVRLAPDRPVRAGPPASTATPTRSSRTWREGSIRASRATDGTKARLLAGVDAWLSRD